MAQTHADAQSAMKSWETLIQCPMVQRGLACRPVVSELLGFGACELSRDPVVLRASLLGGRMVQASRSW